MFNTPERRPSNKKFITPTYAPLSKRYEEEQTQERYCNAVRQNSRVVSCFDASEEYQPKTKTVFAQDTQMAMEENDYPGNFRDLRKNSKNYFDQAMPEEEGVQQNRRVFGQVNDQRLKFGQAN